MDPVTGQLLNGPNKTGEIWLRSPSPMLGYKNRPEQTAATLDGDGFLHTGKHLFSSILSIWSMAELILSAVFKCVNVIYNIFFYHRRHRILQCQWGIFHCWSTEGNDKSERLPGYLFDLQLPLLCHNVHTYLPPTATTTYIPIVEKQTVAPALYKNRFDLCRTFYNGYY